MISFQNYWGSIPKSIPNMLFDTAVHIRLEIICDEQDMALNLYDKIFWELYILSD